MRVAFHTLGCKVNQYETEALREKFSRAGHMIVHEDEAADVYVINTCTVTSLADRKSRQFIRRSRKRNPEAVIAVTGCYAQMKPEEVASIEGVEIVAGTDEKSSLLPMIEEYMRNHRGAVAVRPYEELVRYEDLGVIEAMESRSRAFVKIQEDCNRFCSYCVIPYARGNVRSRGESEIEEEVRGLLDRGYREIVLTGINTALYGADRGSLEIDGLLGRLNRLEGNFRIRLSSLEPTVIDRTYVQRLLRYDKLCHHLHLSVQSGSDHVLTAMNRGYSRSDYLDIVKVLREFDPSYGITTDIITGFPSETEEDFLDSVRMVQEAGFSRVHVFKYSAREGTKAARMDAQVPGEVRARRSRLLTEAAEQQAERFFERSAGESRQTLFEQEEDGMVSGYTDNYIKVYAPAQNISFDRFYEVKLCRKYKDGMLGEIAGQERKGENNG